MSDIPVDVWQLVRDEEGNDLVLLRDADGRVLPIAIGPCEAAAIWVRLAPEKAAPYLRRPWTHDLLAALVERRGARLERVVIDDLSNGTFFASLHLDLDGQEVIADSRPSDAIALLLRVGGALFVNAEVMDGAALTPRPDDAPDDPDDPDEPGDEPRIFDLGPDDPDE